MWVRSSPQKTDALRYEYKIFHITDFSNFGFSSNLALKCTKDAKYIIPINQTQQETILLRIKANFEVIKEPRIF